MKEPLNIFILSNTLLKGGAEKQSVLLANVLNRFYNVTFIVYYGRSTDNELITFLKHNNITTCYLSGSHLKKCLHLFKMFNKNKRAIIFSYLATTNIINALIGSLAGVHFKIGGIRNAHLTKWKMIVQRFLHNSLLNYTIFNNYEGMNLLIGKGFKKGKSKVIHNCIEIIEKGIKQKSRNSIINILTVSRFVPQKDYFTALKALQLLKQKLHNHTIEFVYNIVGFGKLENDIRQWVNDLGLYAEVNIIINPANVRDYYQEADIYLSTSLFEGLSNSIMEAMEFSLPLVATNAGDNKYLVLDGKSGFLTPVRDVQLNAEKLKDLIINPEKRIEFGKQGYNHLKQNFSEEKFKENYLQLIEKLTNAYKT